MRIKLKQAFDLQMGKTPARNQAENWGGDHRWVSIADIGNAGKYIAKTKECITDAGVNASGIKVVPQGTVIMSFKLSIGKTAITAQDMYTNEAIIAFIDKKIFEIDPNYLYHLCCGTDWTAGTNKAVMGLTLNKATLLEKEIPLPDICQQRKIAAKLDKIDAIIADRQQQLTMIEQAVKSRFIELFGNPDTNSKGWDECVLSKKLNVVGGYAFKSDQFNEERGIPVLRIGNINAGFFRPVNLVYWHEDESLERYAMYPGDLVMSLTGTVGKDDYGNVCILGDDYEKYYLNQRNAKLEITEGIDKHYLSQLLKFEQIKKRLTGISRGVRQANISNKDILNLVVPVPSMEIQHQFAAFVEQTDKSKYYSQKFLTLCRSAVNIYEQEWMKCQTLIF